MSLFIMLEQNDKVSEIVRKSFFEKEKTGESFQVMARWFRA